MQQDSVTRRAFLNTAALAGTALASAQASAGVAPAADKLAALGGTPVRTKPFPGWPVVQKNDRSAWMKVLDEGHWCRLDGHYADQFEKVYAEKCGVKHCIAIANGTSALQACLNAIGVGPGDEVIVPPYTFLATINVVHLQFALPIFVDSDRQSFQIDAAKIEAAITPRTRCIMPVHLGGGAADMDAILAVAKKHNIPVIEDTCQSHLAEWKGKKLGSLGDCGCFSFQASKNLNCGEGGAIISNDEALMEKAFAFHNNGRGRGEKRSDLTYPVGSTNTRMTEFQAALLLTQLSRLEEQMKAREENAKYLSKQLQETPGIVPAKDYGGCTRNAYHLYMFRFDKGQFAGASRAQFIKALNAEGVHCSGGYRPLNKLAFIRDAVQSPIYKRIFPAERLQAYLQNNHCPENDRLCEEAVWFGQTMLLGPRSDMDQIVEAVRKIHANSKELATL